MRLIIRDFWDYENEAVLCIPVTGMIGCQTEKLVRHPIAKEAARRFPDIEERIERANLNNAGLPNSIHDIPKMFSFPYSSMEDGKPNIDVIHQSAKYLACYSGNETLYAIPKLEWKSLPFESVFDVWEDFLDDRFHIVQHEPRKKRKRQRRLIRKRRR